ncbi:LysR family transcriptional regulator [Massilia endophytica]|uniref:LysR family transcriptional regulator n=1 Tax=Massilia endophytica TaxID=2899220 RepID=UPI001E4F503A|nr:LysR family transcriptional regulator [Massilia endophytica]UGQ48781.1 LysR family transcriptional regulator [Massilia endophytica]
MDSHIDLRHLRYFLAVAEDLNFGRAAERLHISQPPLSRQIMQLEDQLGVQLFVRSKSGVALTEAGAAFLPEARKTLAQASKAIAVAKAAAGKGHEQFKLGYTTVFDRGLFRELPRKFSERFPGWRLQESGKHSVSLVRDLKNGVIDAALIGLHTRAEGLVVEPIREEPFVVALPEGHVLARKRRLSFRDLDGESVFWFERRLNPGFYDHCKRYFEEIGFEAKLIPEPPDHHILLAEVADGRGIALIPASLASVRRQGVVFRKMVEGTKLTMGIVLAYSSRNPSPIMQPFIELAKAALTAR